MVARTLYGEEHEIFRESVRRFVEKEVTPHREQWENDGKVSREAWLAAGEAGILLCSVPEDYGGGGGDFLHSCVVIEELAKAGATGPGFPLHNEIVTPYIWHYASEEQKRHWLPKMATGEVITAIAMTEPVAGSDLQGIRTTAIADGNHLVINGQKVFITNGQNADLVITATKTDPAEGAKGVSLILVETEREGFERGRNLEKVGYKAQDTSELFYNDVRVPKTNMLGEEGQGFRYLMEQLPQERLTVAVRSAQVIEQALAETVAYTAERKAFGRSIAEFQNTRFKLAEVKTEAAVCRTFVDHCIALHLEAKLDTERASMAKMYTTDLACRVLDECLQLHGGYGYMWEFPIARAWADARVNRIAGGTSEIMKEIIGRSL
ncbi:MAG: acyl-CoA dehydrogenase family protein [Alphaproteobacteria bacterium]|nr:acyl-CoA dehydrogenase family protein [Alphaproteobacteria bacterium]